MRFKIMRWLLTRWVGASTSIKGEDEYGKFLLLSGEQVGEGDTCPMTVIVRASAKVQWYVWHSRAAGFTDVAVFEFGVGRWLIRVVPGHRWMAQGHAPTEALRAERAIIEAFQKGLTSLSEGNPAAQWGETLAPPPAN